MDYKELIDTIHEVVSKRWSDCYACEECTDAATAIETLLAERDAALEDLKSTRSCKYCAFGTGSHPECSDCWTTSDRKNWTWRGPAKGRTQ